MYEVVIYSVYCIDNMMIADLIKVEINAHKSREGRGKVFLDKHLIRYLLYLHVDIHGCLNRHLLCVNTWVGK